MLESLLQRGDVNQDVKSILIQVKKEVMVAQDEGLCARGRAREAYYVLEELLELLGVEVRSYRMLPTSDEQMRQAELSPYLEAVVSEDGKVKIEKLALAVAPQAKRTVEEGGLLA